MAYCLLNNLRFDLSSSYYTTNLILFSYSIIEVYDTMNLKITLMSIFVTIPARQMSNIQMTFDNVC